MAGLLGLDDDMRLALMTAGLGTLAGRGGPMRAAGQGGLLGVASYQQSKRDKADAERERLRDDLLRAQLDEYKRKQSEAERMRQGYSQAFKGAYNPGAPAGLGAVDDGMDAGVQPAVPASFDPRRFAMGIADVDPVEAAKLLIPEKPKSPWADINPKDYTVASLREFSRTKDPSVLVARDDTKPVSKWVDIPAPPGGAGQQWQRNQDTGEIRAVGSRAPVTNNNFYPDLPAGYMWTDPRDRTKGVQPLPGGPEDPANPNAKKPGTGITESQGTAATYLTMMTQADKTLERLGGKDAPFAATVNLAKSPSVGAFATSAGKQVAAAQMQWVEAALRITTGATAPPEEIVRMTRMYFPQPFDDAETVAQKVAARRAFEAGVRIKAGAGGPAADKGVAAIGPGGVLKFDKNGNPI